MTKAEILKGIEMIGDDEYDLLCDNTVVMSHNAKYPIGYIRLDEGEYAVQLRPATIDTDNLYDSRKRFTVLLTPLSSIQYLRARCVREDAAAILNKFKVAGAFTTEEVTSMLNNKELFGIYERQEKKK